MAADLQWSQWCAKTDAAEAFAASGSGVGRLARLPSSEPGLRVPRGYAHDSNNASSQMRETLAHAAVLKDLPTEDPQKISHRFASTPRRPDAVAGAATAKSDAMIMNHELAQPHFAHLESRLGVPRVRRTRPVPWEAAELKERVEEWKAIPSTTRSTPLSARLLLSEVSTQAPPSGRPSVGMSRPPQGFSSVSRKSTTSSDGRTGAGSTTTASGHCAHGVGPVLRSAGLAQASGSRFQGQGPRG